VTATDPLHEIDFAPPAVREAYSSAADALVALVDAIPGDRFDDLGLGVWTVRALVGHAGRSFVTVSEYLRAGAGRAVALGHAFDYYAVLSAGSADQEAVAERGRRAGAELGDDPAERTAALRDAALLAVRDASDDAPVASAAGVMRLVDYLPSRVFELTIHAGDIAAATGLAFSPEPAAATITLACVSHLAAERSLAFDAIMALAGRRPLPDGYAAF
jgi:hypothetical protein